jgi:hypothetical protein
MKIYVKSRRTAAMRDAWSTLHKFIVRAGWFQTKFQRSGKTASAHHGKAGEAGKKKPRPFPAGAPFDRSRAVRRGGFRFYQLSRLWQLGVQLPVPAVAPGT